GQGALGPPGARPAPDAVGVRAVLALRRRRVDLRVLVPLPLAAPALSERAAQTTVASARAAWYAVVAPIVAWLVHLSAEASLVQHTCNSSGTQWPMHAVTAGCVAVTLSAMAVAFRMAQR